MQQLLKCGWGVIHRNGRLIFLLALSLMLSSCSDNPTQPTRAPRNTFPDYQHISGYVSGVWTKEHNPYVITGEVYVDDGDSLIIEDGVELITDYMILIDHKAVVKFYGSKDSPIRFVHESPVRGGGVFVNSGKFYADYLLFEGNGKSLDLGFDTRIDHSVFCETIICFANYEGGRYDSTVLTNSIFAGFRPWLIPSGGAQIRSVDPYLLDSSRTRIGNNLFFTGIGDSSWAIDPEPVVDVWILGKNGNREIKGGQWPGNGNLFGDPKWVKYNFVGPSPAGISDNDYHLQSGSPAIGAASDGTNIGAY